MTNNTIKTNIGDLDAAIRALEISTNPTLRRPCNCNATRHPLLTSAPNCLNCGKIICVKEGLGPCLFCGEPLIPAADVQSMIRMLKEERGKEKMEANNASQRRAEVSRTPRAFASSSSSNASASLSAAQQHRDKLLSFQETSARRTRIIDEAADFETPSSGLSMWASPQERALQLKRQQRLLREQEWNAKPEYEKRRPVVSIDLVGKKVVKRMGNIERPPDLDEEEASPPEPSASGAAGGSFTRNPLLGDLIRPVYASGDGKNTPHQEGSSNPRQKTWRRVQDDLDDNERVILDGGIYGRTIETED